jgi:uncharacterized lipoprotein YajG
VVKIEAILTRHTSSLVAALMFADCAPSPMSVVDSLPTTTRSHTPSSSGVTFSSEMPTSRAT